ncbi:hypothetical protein A2U01_0059821, partial [Trifolium medium]|nr:hypothetical protein [Trifolium medium]
PLARLRPASSNDIGPESFQVSGEKWRAISPGEESPLSPGDPNSRPATQPRFGAQPRILP